MKSVDVVILSAWKRGLWLAQQLAQFNNKVAFIDLSSCWPYVEEEDQAGPFGFFLPKSMNRFQQEWWKSKWTPSLQGFSVLSDDVFFHFKESFLSSVYEKRKDYQFVRNYLKNPNIQSQKFEDHWLVHLVYSMVSSLETTMNTLEPQSFSPLFFQDFGLISFSEENFEFENKNIIYQKRNIFDYRIKKRKEDYLFLNNREIILKTKKIVWMLNPEETNCFHPLLFGFFFKKKVEPSFFWHRFSFDFDFEGYPFPDHFVCASPRHVPWRDEQFIVVKKDIHFKNRLQAWVKLSLQNSVNDSENRFQKTAQRIQEELGKKFPKFKCQLSSVKQNIYPFLFPVYNGEDVKQLKPISHFNIFHAWSLYDMSWNGWAVQEDRILEQLSPA